MKFLDLCKSKVLFKGALFSAIFFSLLLATLVFAPGAKAGANSPTFNNDANGTECAWISDANINCGDVEYWFDLDLTVSKGRAMYHARFEDNWQDGYIIFENDGTTGQIVNGPDKTTDGTDATILDREKRDLRRYAINDNPDTPRDNGELRGFTGPFVPGGDTGEQYFFCGLESGANQKCWSGIGGVEKTVSADAGATLEQLREDITATIDSDENCTQDSGALGFVLCPMLKGIQNAIDALIGGDGSGQGFIVELLTIKPLDPATTPELYRGWEAVRNIALALYVLIFALIIFGNGVGYDPYTIKRALPRLAAGVVLTFASFFIMQTVIDVSNFLGNMVPAFVNWMSEGTAVTTFNFDVNFAYQGISIILIIVFAVVALGALLVGLAGLITRVVIIYGLVLLAPLAFLAWVLPNTEGMFKKWWKNLIKVAMMFPIVTGMLSLSLFFAKIMSQTASSTNNGVLAIAASLAPLIAIILIPKTFKWGGEAFAAAAGYMAGKATAGKDWGKGVAGGASERGRDRLTAGMLERSKSSAQRAGDLSKNGDTAGAKRAMMAGRAQRAMGIMAAGKLPTKRGLVAAGVRAGKTTKEQAEMQETAAQYYSGDQLTSELAKSARKLKKSPDNAIELARFRGLQKAAVQSRNGGALKSAKDIFNTGDEKDNNTYLKASMPNLGDLGENFADMGGFAKGGGYFDPSGLSAEKIAGQHKSTLERWSQDGTFERMSSGQISALKDPRLRQKMSAEQQQFVDSGINKWEKANPVYGPPRPSASGGTTSGSGSSTGTSGGGTTPPPGPTAGGPTPRSPWGPGGLGGPGGGASPAPTTPPPTGGPGYYGTGGGPVPSGGTGAPSPWSPPPAAPSPSLPPMPAAPTAPAPSTGGGSIPPATPVSVSGGSSTPTPVSAPIPAGPSGGGSSITTIVNNNSVNQVFQQSGSLRSQMSGGGLEGYGDLMRKMDGIDAKLASGRVDTASLKKDLKTLRLARESAPESMHGQIDDYMRSAERAAGIPENAGAHDDVDLSEE